MWYRLKSSLLSAALATALVLGFLAIAEPAGSTPEPVGPLNGLTGLDADQERAAFQLAVALTALAIDAAVEGRGDEGKPETERADAGVAAAPRIPAAVRMPFYSFAAKAARRAGSGA